MPIHLLRGKISNLRKKRESASFFFTDSDKTTMGVIAVAAAAIGAGSQAIAVASATTSVEEEADYLEFELDGCDIRGWVWRSPFGEGDEVEAAVEKQGGHFIAYAITRPSDHTIALYPHCSRGKLAHVKNAVKWWLLGVSFAIAFMVVLFVAVHFIKGGEANLVNFFKYVLPLFALAGYLFFGLMTVSMAKKWMPFVRLSERCFAALGWGSPSNIDLVASTKKARADSDPGELGVMYFRY
ncbi:hypothetical protein N8I74_08080 [Chitiniphilus purpureus]|uniref:Uncharacterized protein n=1 Tax=Chitiniphilus purpureus TaxID=2981137 RepID=A0ABY6DRG6_9NEIS|nr:putative type VI secretion system effector [Chitiniphilus sp. CD1]UXY16954.1 hypothetical protein N8I74_08080 [Chitiniphilus sp. CD1]